MRAVVLLCSMLNGEELDSKAAVPEQLLLKFCLRVG